MRARTVAGFAAATLVAGVAAGPGTARANAPSVTGAGPGVHHVEPGQKRVLHLAASVPATVQAWLATPAGRAQQRGASGGGAAGVTPAVGTKRMWPATDFVAQTDYMKEYTLRGVGDAIEVWVASGPGPDGIVGTDVRPGDCRAALPGYAEVTDAQVQGLIREYDERILPKESKAFSVAPARDGSKAQTDLATANLDFSGDGTKVVTLVDNIRDAAFYKFPEDRSGVAGFFAPSFNEMTDRNIMTIDSEDWAHSTGPNPPHRPNQDPCKNLDGSPHFYESVFAHEYQHLLMYYVDPHEVNWVNEGLSMYAERVVGYDDPRRSVNEFGYDPYIACFQGFRTLVTEFNPAPVPCGGPANSLTRWGDQGTAKELLADYGTGFSMMLFLADRFGTKVPEFLHRDNQSQGLSSLRKSLAGVTNTPTVASVLHDYQLMTLVDRVLETRGAKLTGAARAKVTSASLRAAVNLFNPAAFGAVGAAANGADYLALRGLGVDGVRGADLRSLEFRGDGTLPASPMQWTVAGQYPLPTLTAPALPGLPPVDPVSLPELPSTALDNPVLFSGNAANTDASAVFEVTVPASNPLLTYTTVYNLEQNYDFAYTVVSTDGGRRFTTLRNSLTIPSRDGDGLTGSVPVPTPMVFDLTEYAGQKIHLGFRFLSDSLVNAGGWAVDDVRVGGELINDGSSTAPLRTFTQVYPQPVDGWSLQIVGLDPATGRVHVVRSTKHEVKLTAKQIAALRRFPLLVAIVGYDDARERAQLNAPYTLRVNGIGQAGGR